MIACEGPIVISEFYHEWSKRPMVFTTQLLAMIAGIFAFICYLSILGGTTDYHKSRNYNE